MKRIVSVSLGSSKRNHKAEAEILGEKFTLERIGTDGDRNKVIELVKELDGKVDAFGMGGIDVYLHSATRKYIIKDALPIKDAAKITPMLDGSGLKNTLEKRVILYINNNIMPLKNRKVLLVSGVDRIGMAGGFYQCDADVVYGDLIFGLGIPVAIRSFKFLSRIADLLLPIICRMPFEKLYPTGKEQDTITTKYEKYYNDAEIIAGDYLYIKKYMPARMDDKIIVTNTITASDVEDLKSRGVKMLIGTTPEFDGRSFGTNVIEALFSTILNKKAEDITYDDYEKLLDKMNYIPRIEYLKEE
jgi:hypothetical protein